MSRKATAPRTHPTPAAAEPRGSGRLGSLVMLAPLAAGAGAGAIVNRALVWQDLARRFWPGTTPADSRPGEAAVNIAAVAAALLLWIAVAALMRRIAARAPGGAVAMPAALRLEAAAFVPALSLLILSAVDNYGIFPGITLFSIHAVIASVAAFAGVNAFLAAAGAFGAAPETVCEGAAACPVAARLERHGFAAALALAGVYAVTFTAMGFLQYDALNISYTDTASWEQMLHNTLRGRFLETTAFPHMFFGEHVQFLQLFLLPFYALAPSLKTLMLLKSAALASGAIPVYLLAARRLGSRAAAVCFAAAYLLYPAMQWVDLELVHNTFRPEALAIPALLWMVYFFDARRFAAMALAAFFALAAKEEMALPVMMIGVLLCFERRWKWGAAFAGVAAAWFLLSILVVIPYYRQGPSHMTWYYLDFVNRGPDGALVDTSVIDLAKNVLRDPFHAFAVAFQAHKVDYLLMLLAPLAFLSLFSGRMLLVMLPSLATTLLASRDPSYSIFWHYQTALVPFMVMGAVYGAGFLAGTAARPGRFGRWAALLAPGEGRAARAVVAGAAVMALFAALAGNVLMAKSPISLLFYNSRMETYWRLLYVPGERARLFFREVRPLVPDDARVTATEFTATYFAARQDSYVFPDGVGEVDFVVVDTHDRWLTRKLGEKGMTLEQSLRMPGYATVYDAEGFLVYRKDASAPGT